MFFTVWNDGCNSSENSSSAAVLLPGWEDLFKPVLSGLHIQFGIPIERMQKLVNRRLRRGCSRRNGKRAAPQHLHDGKSEEELLNLPSFLEETHQNLLADRIARKILRFQQHCRSATVRCNRATDEGCSRCTETRTAIWFWYCLTCFIKSRSASDFVLTVKASSEGCWMCDAQIVLMHFTVCPVNKFHMLCCTGLHCFVNNADDFCVVLVLHWKCCSLFID